MGWSSYKPSDFSSTMRENLETGTKKIVVGLTAELIKKTPVDTGRARSNWIVTAGTPQTEVQEIEDKSGRPSLESAEGLKVNFGEVIFISNNLPYIGYLNNGTDKMAPFSMVERSLAATVRRFGSR